MTRNKNRKSTNTAAEWEQATTRSSADMLAILAPTAGEPGVIQRVGIWKTGPLTEPAGSAA